MESSVDWQRATLKNTYCRSPTARENEDTESEGSTSNSGGMNAHDDSINTRSDNARTPLLDNSSTTYVTAQYGTHSTATESATTGNSEGGSEGSNQCTIQQGQPPNNQGESNE